MPAAAPATLRFSTDKHELDVDAIYDFLHRDAYWSKGIPRDVFDRSIDGSLCFGAYVGARQVGFARLVTDHATFAYLCDVFVLPAERGKGYGRALIDHVFAQDMVQGLRRIMLVTSDAHALYRPVGFEPPSHPERMMELRRPDIYTAR
ncbi:GNAT family N-acetyltransferase [Burkholderia ubonensis]|uniref:GNAT family N-acetyltransferase n=1 Tax=Burkholderia ubonensis TaxID=101571 RepID=UPI000752BBD2|nr:GNAT family N-acetyltransferase [Burkholderia ubonensis]KVD04289.1 GCN5 family acetyltransferase [Burkholderia ubonensis]KVD60586.1 GCN5 family acetyltransferase [Burkholderia ubonensis]KVD72012.1 GCN5 family acetyltransferase [Burkholderia ubonensis]KVT60009.1 GCN5 family acetyltransferase [Burkholderia ubonensis]KVU92371.1 GCN5 family acetyltransferase [Burkholderia ubonensis]